MTELQHHGVKGQKWGKRKYKALRKSAIKTSNANALIDTGRARLQYKAAINNKKLSKNISSRKRERISNKNRKIVNKYNALTKISTSNNKKIQHLVNSAGKLPLTIKETPKRSRAKKIISDINRGVISNAKYTKKDQFALATKNAQGNKTKSSSSHESSSKSKAKSKTSSSSDHTTKVLSDFYTHLNNGNLDAANAIYAKNRHLIGK